MSKFNLIRIIRYYSSTHPPPPNPTPLTSTTLFLPRRATNKEQSIQIASSSGLSDSDVDRLVKEAEEFASADRDRKAFVDAKNDGDSLMYSTEKSLHEHKAKLDAKTIEEVETALKDVKEALEKESDVENLKAKVTALQNASMSIGKAIYAAGSKTEEKPVEEATEATKADSDDSKEKK